MDEMKTRLLLETERELTEKLTEAERYMYYLGRMQYLRYELGRENLLRSDCSGSVCLALLLATGCSIRVTADALFRKYFTVRVPGKGTVRAAFFITSYDREDGGRLYREGEVCHCAGLAGEDVVLNCTPPRSVLRSLTDLRAVYRAMDYRVEVRGLDREALQKASDEGKDLFGADIEFMEYRNAITGVK